MPAVQRGGEKFLAVHIVQLKLLSKFPPNIPAEMTSRFTMVSHKMLAVEAWFVSTRPGCVSSFLLQDFQRRQRSDVPLRLWLPDLLASG